MKKYLIFIFLLGWLGSFAQVSGSLQTQAQDYAFNSVSQYTDIQLITPPTNVTATTLDSVAAPKLPVFIQNFVLPAGSQVTGLQVNSTDLYTFNDTYYIAPVQPPCPACRTSHFVAWHFQLKKLTNHTKTFKNIY